MCHSAPQEPEERSLTVGVAIAGYYAVSAWSQVLVWPAKQAPYCKQLCLVVSNFFEALLTSTLFRQAWLAVIYWPLQLCYHGGRHLASH